MHDHRAFTNTALAFGDREALDEGLSYSLHL